MQCLHPLCDTLTGVLTLERDDLSACWDAALDKNVLTAPIYFKRDLYGVLASSLWGRNILTLSAAQELNMNS
jgi:hypothetical protein